MPWDSYSGGYYQDPNGLPGYDEWKLRSPYDGPLHEPDPCEHEEYEIDWQGEATCSHCGDTWWPSTDAVKAYWASERRAEREWRRYNSWYMRAWRWLTERRQRTAPDDDIPF